MAFIEFDSKEKENLSIQHEVAATNKLSQPTSNLACTVESTVHILIDIMIVLIGVFYVLF